MENPSFQIIYLDLQGNWSRYRCHVSGDFTFSIESGDKKCHLLVRDGHATIAKLVGESGEVLIWDLTAGGKPRRTVL